MPRVDALQRRAQLLRGEIARHAVDGLELGPVDGHHVDERLRAHPAGCLRQSISLRSIATEEPQLSAEQVELAEDRLERRRIVPAEIGDGLEVGPELPQQPEHFEIAPALQLQTAAGAHLVEVTPEVELQKIARRKGRPAGVRRRGAGKAAGLQVEPIDKGLEEAHRMLPAHVILQAFRQQQRLRAIHASDKGHGCASDQPAPGRGRVFTGGANIFL